MWLNALEQYTNHVTTEVVFGESFITEKPPGAMFVSLCVVSSFTLSLSLIDAGEKKKRKINRKKRKRPPSSFYQLKFYK